MKIISHRGNLNGPNSCRENSPEAIFRASSYGYNVEVDLWIINNCFYFGHDIPKYKITKDFIEKISNNTFFHIKCCIEAELSTKLNYFIQNEEPQVITSAGQIWCHSSYPIFNWKSILTLSETQNIFLDEKLNKCYGICTDYPNKWKINQ